MWVWLLSIEFFRFQNDYSIPQNLELVLKYQVFWYRYRPSLLINRIVNMSKGYSLYCVSPAQAWNSLSLSGGGGGVSHVLHYSVESSLCTSSCQQFCLCGCSNWTCMLFILLVYFNLLVVHIPGLLQSI